MNLLALIFTIALRFYGAKGVTFAGHEWLTKLFSPYFILLERNLNDGEYLHGIFAWMLAALLPSVLVAFIFYFLSKLHPALGLVFSVFILYVTLRFVMLEPQAEQIAAALQAGNIDSARKRYADWQEVDSKRFTQVDIAKFSIEQTFADAHLYLFGPLFWFIVLGLLGFGPAPTLLYQLSNHLKNLWANHGDFGRAAQQMFNRIDWIPSHASAGAFAIVGDFEDALYCWRTQAQTWADANLGMVLATGAGALGVKIGDRYLKDGIIQHRAELGLADEADADYIRGAVGMVWRVLVLLLGMLFLLTLAYWLGN